MCIFDELSLSGVKQLVDTEFGKINTSVTNERQSLRLKRGVVNYIMITQQMISSDIDAQYSKPEERAAASQAYNLGLDWVNSQPKTWCQSEDRQSRRDKRREDRQKKREQYNTMYDYIHTRMVPSDVKSVEGVQVVGFGIIALIILETCISWVVWKILDHFWNS